MIVRCNTRRSAERLYSPDGKTQSAAHDEFVYHESLVHPPLFINAVLNNGSGGPKSVFIGGGGELATAREVLKHNTVERLVMVDLDGDVIEVCKKYLPEWGGETVANHPKMELIIGDAHKYLTETTEKFDVICMDISDPIEAGPGIALYTQEFYRHASTLLNDNGVFVTQAGSADFIPHVHAVPGADESGDSNKDSWCFAAITNTLATVFDSAIPYTCQVPSFGEDWGFVLAFNRKSSGADWHPRRIGSEEIDTMIKDRIENIPGIPAHHSTGRTREYTGSERGGDALLHYDGEIHGALFSLSKPLREGLKRDTRIMTVENPVFMY